MSVSLTSLGATADAVAHAVDRLHGPVTLVRRSYDLVEVLSVVHSGLANAVLVAEGAEHIGAEAMDSLYQARAVVGVVEGFDDARLVELGAYRVPANAQASDAARMVIEAAQHGVRHGSTLASRSAHETEGLIQDQAVQHHDPAGDTSDPWADESLPDTSHAVMSEDAGHQPSGIVVVWGPHGSPGRSTVAVNVAAEIAHLGYPVTVVDLDTWGPSVATMLGLLDETAGVALACRAADRHRLDHAALDRASVRVDLGGAHMDVLTGLTRPERWPELRGGSVDKMLQACRNLPSGQQGAPPIVVVDVGFCLDEDEELSFDTQAPQRNAAALTAVEVADVVVAVVSADVVGLTRAATSLPGLLERTTGAVMVVANKVRQTAAGRSPRAGVRDAWESMGVPVRINDYLSFDPITMDQALLDGSVLLESSGKSAVRAEINAIAQNVLRRLSGDDVVEAQEEVIKQTRFGRRMGAWLRR
ncbi:MAG: P-loop NTPase [Kocuria sp.]|nr:P-loop NTPase [Kocuria sp.]